MSDEHSPNGDAPQNGNVELAEALPGLLRVVAGVWMRTGVWMLETGVRVARASVSPNEVAELAEEWGSGIRSYARELLGVSDLDERVRQLVPARERPAEEAALRAQGAELLRQSADVDEQDGAHPAYARILSELAPDEGRILRLLMLEGPQPCIDVRASNLIGVGTQLIAQGLTMVGTEAGCRHVDRVPAYLNNLRRLGLIAISNEPLSDPLRYQVLEAQPEAVEAIKRARHARTVHRRAEMTPFGTDFCETVLPLEPVDKALPA
jgi:Abortive infection alpha